MGITIHEEIKIKGKGISGLYASVNGSFKVIKHFIPGENKEPSYSVEVRVKYYADEKREYEPLAVEPFIFGATIQELRGNIYTKIYQKIIQRRGLTNYTDIP